MASFEYAFLREFIEAKNMEVPYILGSDGQQRLLKDLGTLLLHIIGEDPDREGLRDTPARWAKWWQEFINYDPGKTGTSFETVTADQMVIVKGIPIWSLCEHHLLPFSAVVHIAYITEDKVLGLSKFARIAQKFAHSLQVQERLVTQIADEVKRLTGSKSVAVYAEGEHLCMRMRGIKSDGKMITSVVRGDFRTDAPTRQEFLSLIKE